MLGCWERGPPRLLAVLKLRIVRGRAGHGTEKKKIMRVVQEVFF